MFGTMYNYCRGDKACLVVLNRLFPKAKGKKLKRTSEWVESEKLSHGGSRHWSGRVKESGGW